VVVAILCAILVVALAVGVFAFFRTTDSNLALADSNAAEARVAGKDGEPYYVLGVADPRRGRGNLIDQHVRGRGQNRL